MTKMHPEINDSVFYGVCCLIALVALLLLPAVGVAGSYEFAGQASAWFNSVRNHSEWKAGIGMRYIPQLTLTQQVGDESLFDLEISLDALASGTGGSDDDTAYVELYRLKWRFATARTVTRLGLQQINFGPAYLLRPLKWFDVLDPRDPQHLTDGVYAASFKYVSLGNSTIWLWALYGNDEPKGYEIFPTLKDRVEYGGRAQVPLLSGEAGFTYHHRMVDGPDPFVGDFAEYRVGLDGRWDIVVGSWFETAFAKRETDMLPYTWSTMTTLGMDYTFGLGNGVHTLVEHTVFNSSDEPFELDEVSNISGLSLSYPLGYIDRLSAISFYLWDNGDYSQHVAWDHYWELLSLNVSLFYYPERPLETPVGVYNPITTGGDSGGQVVLIFHH